MEKNFYNDEFEEFIKQKSGQYKMYPSDKVWKNIHSSLHTRRKWFIAGMFSLITGILFFAGKGLIAPTPQHASIKKPAESAVNNSSATNNNSSPNKKIEPVVSITPAFTEYKVPSEKAGGNNHVSFLNIDSLTSVLANANEILANSPVEYNNVESSTEDKPINNWTANANTTSFADNAIVVNDPKEIENNDSIQQSPIHSLAMADKEDLKKISLLENYASYQLASPKKLNRKYWQLYVTPTMNYRQLSGSNAYNAKADLPFPPIALTAPGTGPNQYTNNKPALGFEIGSNFLYRYTRNLSFKVGLQFNYSRYTINAYALNTQPVTILLNSINPYQTNSITSNTNISNIGGKATVNLQNQYFQISAPVGFELRVMGNEKLQLHVGATIQPTYLLNRNSYLLSSDYTSYTQEPSLFRKWNAYGAVEAFITYKMGKIRWQLGPQFSYQLFSTYTSQYPITENLKDFGFKFGFSKAIW